VARFSRKNSSHLDCCLLLSVSLAYSILVNPSSFYSLGRCLLLACKCCDFSCWFELLVCLILCCCLCCCGVWVTYLLLGAGTSTGIVA
jgi:hypothetical protein